MLVFLIQWIFLGNLRSAVIVGLNIPFALFFATIVLVITTSSRNRNATVITHLAIKTAGRVLHLARPNPNFWLG